MKTRYIILIAMIAIIIVLGITFQVFLEYHLNNTYKGFPIDTKLTVKQLQDLRTEEPKLKRAITSCLIGEEPDNNGGWDSATMGQTENHWYTMDNISCMLEDKWTGFGDASEEERKKGHYSKVLHPIWNYLPR